MPNITSTQASTVLAVCESSLCDDSSAQDIAPSPSDIVQTICQYIDDFVDSLKPEENHRSCARDCSGIVHRAPCGNTIQLDLNVLVAYGLEAAEVTTRTPSVLPLEVIREIIVNLTCAHCHDKGSSALENRAKLWHIQGIKWTDKDRPFAEPITPDCNKRRQNHRARCSRSSSSLQSRGSVRALAEPETPTSRPQPTRRKASAGRKPRPSTSPVADPDDEDERIADSTMSSLMEAPLGKIVSVEHVPELVEDPACALKEDLLVEYIAIDSDSADDDDDGIAPSTVRLIQFDTELDEVAVPATEYSLLRVPGAFSACDTRWDTRSLTSSRSAQEFADSVESDMSILADDSSFAAHEAGLEQDCTADLEQDNAFELHHDDLRASSPDPPAYARYSTFEPHSKSLDTAAEQIAKLSTSLKQNAKCPQQGGVYGMQLLSKPAGTPCPFVKIGLTHRHWLDRIKGIEKEANAEFDRRNVIWQPPDDAAYVECLEEFVHRDLQHLQYRRSHRSGQKEKSQIEWFKISMKDARIVIEFWREVCDEMARCREIGDESIHKRIDKMERSTDSEIIRGFTHAERVAHYRKILLGPGDPTAKSRSSPSVRGRFADAVSSGYHTALLIILTTVTTMACASLLHLFLGILYHATAAF